MMNQRETWVFAKMEESEDFDPGSEAFQAKRPFFNAGKHFSGPKVVKRVGLNTKGTRTFLERRISTKKFMT